MKRVLLDELLCCPVDRAFPLEVAEGKFHDDELEAGALRCRSCGATFPVREGIPVLLPPKGLDTSDVAEAKERESKARDEDSKVYDGTVPPYQTEVELAALLEGIDPRPGERVLDLGAGTGRLTVELARRGATVLAMDISPVSLAANRQKCRAIPGSLVHHLAVDACYLPLRDGVIHKAGSGMMIEHLPTHDARRRCLEEVHRVLAPGGRMALTAYNYTLGKRRRGERSGFHGKDLYFYNFERKEMRDLLRPFRIRTLTALINLPRLNSRRLDEWISKVPPVAGLTGHLLFAVAER